jgi:hypothetical protein
MILKYNKYINCLTNMKQSLEIYEQAISKIKKDEINRLKNIGDIKIFLKKSLYYNFKFKKQII